MTEVSIPDTVTSIGDNAFEGATSLTEVDIPDTVTSIEYYAFANTALTELILPKNLTTIGARILQGNTGVTEIIIPKSVTEMGNVVAGYKGPFDGITRIPSYAFQGATSLTEVSIPDTVTSIGDNAFAGAISLAEMDIPDTVTSIEYYAFADTALTKLELPENLTTIGARILQGNKGVSKVIIPKGVTEMYYNVAGNTGSFDGSQVQKAEFEKGITRIPSYAFQGATNLAEVLIPDTVTSIGNYAFAGTALAELELPENLTTIGARILQGNTSVSEVIIPKSVTEMHYNVAGNTGSFDGSQVQEAEFEEGMKNIPAYAFQGATNLKKVSVPDTVTSIESYAFQSTGLAIFQLKDNITNLGEYVFANCGNLEEVNWNNTLSEIPKSTFSECISLKKFNMTDVVKAIGENAFQGCESLENFDCTKNITTIKAGAFSNCSALKTVDIGDSVTSIGQSAFSECRILNEIIIGKSVTVINDNAFKNCDALKEISLPDSVETIGNSAFYNCDSLAAITIPDSVTSIGSSIFYDCDALTDVTLGTGITSIPSSAFEHCDVLQSIVLPYRTATVGANAFKNCVALTEITIPRATTSIDATAFSYPSKMTVYGVAGTYAETFANEQGMKFVNKEVNAEKVALSQSELKLNKGEQGKLVMAVTPADFTDEVTWKSSDSDVVTVDDSGQISAKSVGEVTVKVQVGSVSDSCSVTVVQPVTSISLDKKSLKMDALDTYQLTARVSPSDAADKSVRWSSSDEKIASVDENGLVTALKKGNATITVEAQDGSGVSSTCSVTVKNTAHVAADVSEMESTHPYANNCSDFWVYTLNGADGLSVTFDAQTELEDQFDYLHIFNAAGEEIGQYTGTELAGQTVHVPGDTVKLQLVSDDAGTAWGFKVGSITADGTQKLPQVISGTDSYEKTYGDENFILDAQLTQGDGSLSYRSEDENVVTVSGDGEVTIVGIGKTNIVVTASETAAYNKAEKYISISIICKHIDESRREIKNEKEAKCTENGYTGDVYCTVCGEKVEDGTVIPAIGHRWDDGEVTKEATADSDGVMTYTCQNCGAERTERIPAIGKPTDDTGQGNNPGQGGNTGPSDSGNQVNGGTNGSSSGNTAGGSPQTSDGKQQTSSGAAPAAGAVIRNPSTGDTYKVVSPGRTVEYRGSVNQNKKAVNVPDTVVVDGVRYQVASIANNAFKNNKKLTSVVIGKNVTKIGKKAFFGCQKLKKITIKTTKLKTKTVGAKAFTKAGSKNYSKLTVKVPKKCKKTYPKILRKKGLSGRAKIK